MTRMMLLVGALLLWAGTAQAAGLMNGATASSYTIPAGWSAVIVQGFETGAINTAKEFTNASVTTARAHTGTRSVGGQISGDGGGVRWVLLQSNHASREVYISYWDYMDSQATFNDEQFQNLFKITNAAGFQHVYYDWFYGNPGGSAPSGNGEYNAPAGNLIVVSEGVGPGELHRTLWETGYQPASAPQRGQWVQFEVHFKANTPGLLDGFFRSYINGVQRVNISSRNLNGSIEMRGMSTQVGGTYTRHVWRHPTTNACGTYIGDGAGIAKAGFPETNFRCTDFNNCSCPPNTAVFSRYFDDVIVMVPSGSGGGQPSDTTPPGPPANLTVSP